MVGYCRGAVTRSNTSGRICESRHVSFRVQHALDLGDNRSELVVLLFIGSMGTSRTLDLKHLGAILGEVAALPFQLLLAHPFLKTCSLFGKEKARRDVGFFVAYFWMMAEAEIGAGSLKPDQALMPTAMRTMPTRMRA